MAKQAGGFSLADNDANQAFDLQSDGKQDAATAIHDLAQTEGATAKFQEQTNKADEQDVVRLDIDSDNLIKVAQNNDEPKNKKKRKYYEAYKKLHGLFSFGKGIPVREKQTFYELIAVMLEAGIPIVNAIRVYGDQTNHRYFQKVCQAITWQLEKGQKFSDILADYPKIFPEAERGIIAAAEATGRLVESLRRISTEVEKISALTRRVRGALIYPAIVMVFVAITLYVLLRFVIPQISQLFTQTGLELPAITQFIIDASSFVVDNGWLIAGGIIAVVMLNYGLYKVKSVRYYYHLLALKVPTLGSFQKDYAQASFARSLANLVASGVGIVPTLGITAKSLNNLVYRRQIELLQKDVTNGIGIGDSLANSPYFSNMLVSMLTVAERTAQIDNIANKLANYYTDKVYDSADNLTKLLQPIVIGVVGIIVGIIVLSIMLPMTDLLSGIGA